MRKHYLDNIRWVTVVIVVIYHVFYMYNSEGVLGGLGQITNLQVQYYDAFQYLVYPWIMPLLFIVSGISARLSLEQHTDKEFIKSILDNNCEDSFLFELEHNIKGFCLGELKTLLNIIYKIYFTLTYL